MQYHDRIKAIRERAATASVPIGDLCRAGKINPSTLSRWEEDKVDPRRRKMDRALDAMEGELARRERALIETIASRTPAVIAAALGGNQP